MAEATRHPELSAAEQRRILRAAVWQRGRWPLLGVVAVLAAGLGAIVGGVQVLSVLAWQGDAVHDGTLRFTFLMTACVLVAGLHRSDTQLRRWLRRLPVDPARLLQARLQIAVACALVVLGVFFLVEWVAAPALFQPSFEARLNPIEIDTFERLPGAPLVRWQIDGETREGLLSAWSLAALQSRRPFDVGSHGRWTPRLEALPAVEPGDPLPSWSADDWDSLDRWWVEKLTDAGIPRGAPIDATLVRYVPEDEVREGMWRRDGLFRPQSSAALDRAATFLGLVVLLVCLGSVASQPSTRIGRFVGLTVLGSVIASYLFAAGWRRWVGWTDVDQGQNFWFAQIPTLAPHTSALDAMLWPALVAAGVVATVAWSMHETRRAAYGREAPARLPKTSVRYPEIPISAACLVVLLGLGYQSFLLDGYLSTVAALMVRLACTAGLGLTAAILVVRWSRADPILSRLPTSAARQTARRLAVFGAWSVVFAVVLPIVLAELPGLRPTATLSASGGDGFTREDAFFLDHFGAVPVLAATGERSARAIEEGIPSRAPYCTYYRDDVYRWDDTLWRVPPGGFLPRSRAFLSTFARHLNDVELDVGSTVDVALCELTVRRLLTSRAEVEAFLASAETEARGPAPGSQQWKSALEIVASGVAVLFVATWCRSRLLVWMVTPGVLWIMLVANRIAWFKTVGLGHGILPWWGSAGGVGIVVLLVWLTSLRLRRNIERGYERRYRDALISV